MVYSLIAKYRLSLLHFFDFSLCLYMLFLNLNFAQRSDHLKVLRDDHPEFA